MAITPASIMLPLPERAAPSSAVPAAGPVSPPVSEVSRANPFLTGADDTEAPMPAVDEGGPEAMSRIAQLAGELAAALDAAAGGRQLRLRFEIDGASRQTIIRVMDANSGEQIRQLPPEEVVRLREVLAEGANPALLDVEA